MKRIAGNRHRIQQFGTAIIVFVFMAGVPGCIPPYSGEHYGQLSALKDMHLRFIDSWTTAKPEAVDGEKVAAAARPIEEKFGQAQEFAANTKDKLRIDNIKQLHDTFADDVSLLKEGKTFSKTYAEERKTKVLVPIYDKAMEGEAARPGAPK